MRGTHRGKLRSWCQNVPCSETRLLAEGTEWSQSLAEHPCTMPQTYSEALPLSQLLSHLYAELQLVAGERARLGKEKECGGTER